MKHASKLIAAAVALMASAAATAAASAASMTFRMLPVGERCGAKCPQMIVAEGEISIRTPQDFAEFVRRQAHNPNASAVILLHSSGGRVGASMQLGQLFRTVGAAVIVGRAGSRGIAPGNCYSACVYALVGAKKRVVPPASRVGVHRMFAYEIASGHPEEGTRYERVHATPDLVRHLSDYVGKMGVSRELIDAAERTSSDRLRIVTPREMRRWRLGSDKF